MNTVTLESKQLHRDKLHRKDYIALLSLPTGQHKYDRKFLTKKGHKDKKGYAYFTWDITEPGIYEIREDLEYMIDTSYIAINHNGDVIPLKTQKEVNILLNNMDHWPSLSRLRIQSYKLRM